MNRKKLNIENLPIMIEVLSDKELDALEGGMVLPTEIPSTPGIPSIPGGLPIGIPSIPVTPGIPSIPVVPGIPSLQEVLGFLGL